MALVLTDDQMQFRDQARKLVKAKAPVEQLRKLRDSKDPTGYSADLWREMGGLGWAGILVPESFGGAGLGYQELGVILEEMGRQLVASPLWSTALAGATALLKGAHEGVQKEVLPGVAAGKTVVALAVDEGPHHNPSGVATKAEKTASGYRLTGKKVWVADGQVADWLVISARTAGGQSNPADTNGISLFLVKGDAKGVNRKRLWTADSRGWADVEFGGAEVPATHVLGPLDGGWELLNRILDAGRAGIVAEMLGALCDAFERTLEYLKVRTQFGVPIGSFQALQHRAAQMFCEVELSRSLVREAFTALDEQRPDAASIVSAAKVQVSDTFRLVSSEAVQMHGGIGVTDEHEIGFYLKRARVLEQHLGSPRFHRDRFAALSGY